MINDTITNIEARIRNSDSLPGEKKQELLQLLSKLEGEVSELSKTHNDEARSIAGFTDVSAHEATRQNPNPELLQLSIDGLSASVTGFEKSHPRLVQIVNAISNTLSNLGI